MNEIIENNTTDVSATSFHADSLQVPQAVADQVQVKNRIQQLADNATDWHDTVYATSNEMLYGILKNCYAYYEAMCVNDGLATQQLQWGTGTVLRKTPGQVQQGRSHADCHCEMRI